MEALSISVLWANKPDAFLGHCGLTILFLEENKHYETVASPFGGVASPGGEHSLFKPHNQASAGKTGSLHQAPEAAGAAAYPEGSPEDAVTLRASGQNLLPPRGGRLGQEVSRQGSQGVVSPHPNPPPQGGREKAARPKGNGKPCRASHSP